MNTSTSFSSTNYYSHTKYSLSEVFEEANPLFFNQ
jgi:hypothetical protein